MCKVRRFCFTSKLHKAYLHNHLWSSHVAQMQCQTIPLRIFKLTQIWLATLNFTVSFRFRSVVTFRYTFVMYLYLLASLRHHYSSICLFNLHLIILIVKRAIERPTVWELHAVVCFPSAKMGNQKGFMGLWVKRRKKRQWAI